MHISTSNSTRGITLKVLGLRHGTATDAIIVPKPQEAGLCDYTTRRLLTITMSWRCLCGIVPDRRYYGIMFSNTRAAVVKVKI